MRPSGRAPEQPRDIRITRHYTRHAEGSVLAECGCFLPEVLQLGPTDGPLDFQYCTDELFSSAGRDRYLDV